MSQEIQWVVVRDIRNNLRVSSKELCELKLYKSSKWSSEALCGMVHLPEGRRLSGGGVGDDGYESPLKSRKNHDGNVCGVFEGSSRCLSNQLTPEEYDLYLLGSSLFDCKEFDRCSYFLKEVSNPKLKFLKLYCDYLSWDKKSQEKMESLLTTGKIPSSKNNDDQDNDRNNDSIINFQLERNSQNVSMGDGHVTSVSVILNELNTYLNEFKLKNRKESEYEKMGLGIALLYYLRGILEKAENNKSQAMSSFLKSLSIYSFNWACWLELSDCITRADESLLLLKYLSERFTLDGTYNYGAQQDTKQNVLIKFFKLNLFQEFNGNLDEFIDDLEYLLGIFPNFSYLKAQNALINYNYMDYLNSEQLFEQIIKADPYRLDDLDVYSNILYVMQKHPKLSYLAQFSSQVDRFRPETCCIIANYYSARQEHEKSIMYFRRALTLNKKNTSAWTLMGHEFVELKNSQAAIECYRRAVDINPRDFKAWYGLGQAYEVLDMHLYSLYYFQKACTLKPLDKRMWQALASCYAKVGNIRDSIKSYERALQLSLNADQDSTLLYRLAELYEQIHDVESCKNFMIKCVEIEKATEGMVTEETAKAHLWLARYEMKRRNYEEAYNYAVGVSHGTSQDIEEARAITRDCRRRLQ
ncbi:hypothetical protein Kpol_1050p82 [Vanderwaltozyma polyspora DSM 70294]|uniref:Cdc23 domain-containing protein n=1 Tax=Vanderwaltozyma polyspora (strain ATCC 22028 / DSM 70294 / BCRC 21397 / CBS 2163 / NBRC 10782 / NRRL Y-8283 / UCD 57-17) TaxID=436907 RepID=A7TEX6_VANPO|nr:uncharacterized protein Kpol_1050p82 [Vanderwaltozyma polyspora DSM 70294]EDO19222.1 hypothetical protein Kpol_1050p82 [Vanderwaltozyma polyspora DSM 70294]